MNRTSRLLDLVVRWEELRANGTAVALEDLCRDCPELVDQVRELLRTTVSMDASLQDNAQTATTGQETVDLQATHIRRDSASEPSRASWGPTIVPPGYELLEELGRGGMGVVYKARQIPLDRIVALKTLLPCRAMPDADKRRFLREARIMGRLQHPNIVQIHEVVDHGEEPLLVMEYVAGGNLSVWLGGKPLAPRAAAELVCTLTRAVQAAHDQGVVHRDLKPTNVLLAADGTPKICDFGLAKWFGGPSDDTQTGQLVGTPSYMPPELLRTPPPDVTPASDVYGLGTLLYELLTGRPPFLADNLLDTLHLVNTQEPVPPRRLQLKTPRDLETICLKCLEKEPSRRYASAIALADDLERYLTGKPINARPVGFAERAWRWSHAHPTAALLVAAVIMSAAVVLAIVVAFNRRLAEELQWTATEHRHVLAVQTRLQDALANEVAGRIDGDLRELAAVPLTLASLLENRRDWSEQELCDTMHAVLGHAPLVFGLCVAFEPREWHPEQEDFALYVFRSSGGLTVKRLLLPSYEPIYRQWDWYRVGKDSPHGRWSEPYVGQAANHTPMLTFSAPIRRDGRFVGVVTADLAMDYFRELRRGIDRLGVGPQGSGFVVSAKNQILAHPDNRFEFPGPNSALTAFPLDERFRHLIDQWHHASSGEADAVDFATGRPSRFTFACVPSAGWAVVLTSFYERPDTAVNSP